MLKETRYLEHMFLSSSDIIYENKVTVVQELYPKLISMKK